MFILIISLNLIILTNLLIISPAITGRFFVSSGNFSTNFSIPNPGTGTPTEQPGQENATGNQSGNAAPAENVSLENTTETRNIIIAAPDPQVQFVTPTETSGSSINRNFVLINATALDASLANITINLYNSTSLINSTTTLTSPNFANFTDLSNGLYLFNATAIDTIGNSNSTETRNVTVSYQNLSIQVHTLKEGYTANQGINITDPDESDADAPQITSTYVGPSGGGGSGRFGLTGIESSQLLISAHVKGSRAVSNVTAQIPTSAGSEEVSLSLVNGSSTDGTWQAIWSSGNKLPGHYVVLLTATNSLGKKYYSYISVGDPPGLWILPSNNSDPTGLWTNLPNSMDGDTHTYASDNSNPGAGWGSFITFNVSQITSDRVRVWADYYTQVNAVDIDVVRDGNWTDVYQGPIDNLNWYEANFTIGNVTGGRFRFNYTVGGWIYWLYEFQFYNISTQVNLPVVTTREATAVEDDTAILHATTLSDGGDKCQIRFIYGENTSYTNATDWQSPEYTVFSMSSRINGLQNGKTYHFIAQINNSAGQTNGSDQSFTTGPAAVGWVSATGYDDPSNQWDNEISAFDDELVTETRSYHEANDPDGLMSFYLYLNRTPVLSDKIRFNAKSVDVDLATVDIYNGSSWINIYNSSFTDSAWTIASFNQTNVSQARIQFRAIANNRGFEWRLAEFNFFKTVTTAPENQSKLLNNGTTNASCYLLMKTQYWNGTTGLDDDVVVNETTPRQLQPSQILKLDTIWNPMNYSTNNLSFGDGAYRIYAACMNSTGGTIRNVDGSYVNTTYNFAYSITPPTVNITSPVNGTNYVLGSIIPIKANVTDAAGVSTVTANISYSIGYEIISLIYNATSGLWETGYSNTNYVDTYKITINATDINGVSNSIQYVYANIIDTTLPSVALSSPLNGYSTISPATVAFQCNATDNNNVQNISMYITNSSNQSFSLNQTAVVSGTSTHANFTLNLTTGTYTWNCKACDSSANCAFASSNRTLTVNVNTTCIASLSTSLLNFGTVAPGTDTGANSLLLRINNTGTATVTNTTVRGTNWTDSGSNNFIVNYTKYGDTNVTYTSLTSALTASDAALANGNISSGGSLDTYWGLAVPNAQNSAVYNQTITVTMNC